MFYENIPFQYQYRQQEDKMPLNSLTFKEFVRSTSSSSSSSSSLSSFSSASNSSLSLPSLREKPTTQYDHQHYWNHSTTPLLNPIKMAQSSSTVALCSSFCHTIFITIKKRRLNSTTTTTTTTTTTNNNKIINNSHDKKQILPLTPIVVYRNGTNFFQYFSNSIKRYQPLFLIIFGVLLAYIVKEKLKTDNPQKSTETTRLFQLEELKQYQGPASVELYLAILGHVFNVSRAPKFYGADGSYRLFVGRDASRSFNTGDMSEQGLSDDLTGLNDEDISSVYEWLQFYYKDYSFIGKLIGRYFDQNGNPTQQWFNVLKSVEVVKEKNKRNEKEQQEYPPCNNEFSQATGKRVWCTNKSGGIERSWIGFPRRLFSTEKKIERCACILETELNNPNLKEYDNCPPTSHECKLST
ncbi:unnamed protein product [Didymodactylos carnosus]|uniref:Cytochrome b5 heme-binding domain-containing protein n=1 Tax=Didymodactylos carnosus TaxID=1234261 RepID=A0A8S2CMS4_9BILA|nr:unnamed protein product [Didymodactylos carnosus]CAF3529198.1 unnamed protein product [Didymodactylos carnosus]